MWVWFHYIYYISLVMMIFGFIWKWIVALPVALLQIVTKGHINWVSIPLIAIGNYFIASFIALYGLGMAYENNSSFGYSLFLFILGGFLYIFHVGFSIVNLERDAEKTGDYEILNSIKYRYIALLLGLIMYVIILFMPSVGLTSIGTWFLNKITFISDIKYLGWILGLIAFLYALYIVFMGLIMIGGLIGSLVNLFRKEDTYTEY